MSSFRTPFRQVSQGLLVAAMVIWTASAAGADAGTSAQLRRGAQLAQERCSACHVVAAQQENPPLLKEPAPTFQSIANRPELNEKTLRQFITTTHWDLKSVPVTMPNQELSKADTTAVIRYILSLKGS